MLVTACLPPRAMFPVVESLPEASRALARMLL